MKKTIYFIMLFVMVCSFLQAQIQINPETTLTDASTVNFGFAVALGDLDGDGIKDLVVSDTAIGSPGRIYVFKGQGNGVFNTSFTNFKDGTGTENFGYALACADLDKDGKEDIIVTSPDDASYRGKITIFFGMSPLSSIFSAPIRNPLTQTGDAANDFFGISVATGGDVDGSADNTPDIAVGASTLGTGYVSVFSVNLVAGPPAIPAPLISLSLHNKLLNPGSTNYLGTSVALLRFDNDALYDVAAGAYGGNGNAGYFAVFFNGQATSPLPFQITGTGSEELGTSIANAGNVGGGTQEDLIIGAPGASKAYIYHGGDGPDTTVDATFTGPVASRFGVEVAGGEYNGAGGSDVMIGMASSDNAHQRVFIYYSPFIADETTPDATAMGVENGSNDNFGTALALGLDTAGTPRPFIVVGARTYDPAILKTLRAQDGAVFSYLDPATPVELVFFKGASNKDHIVLTWETASEFENAGFHIWRSETKKGKYRKITGKIIPTQGGATWGAKYSYNDFSVEPGKKYYYKLQDISYNGKNSFHGPVKVVKQK